MSGSGGTNEKYPAPQTGGGSSLSSKKEILEWEDLLSLFPLDTLFYLEAMPGTTGATLGPFKGDSQ